MKPAASNARPGAVVLLSAGLDSTVNLALAVKEHAVCLALTVDYGQRSARREIAMAERLARHYRVPWEPIALPWLGRLAGNALTDASKALPVLTRLQLDDASGAAAASAAAVWVPNRNGIFLNIAAAYAETLDAQSIIVGFNREEAATFPDNTEEFARAATAALQYSTRTHPRVMCYTQALTKREIMALAMELKVPLEWIWSCYDQGEVMCGRCESCLRCKRAWEAAGAPGQAEGMVTFAH